MSKNITFADHKIETMKLKGYFFAALSAISYGMIPLFAIPLKSEEISFDTVLFYRFFFASAMIALYMLIRKKNLKVSAKELKTLMLLGVLFALSSICLFTGYDYLSAGIASTILFMYPVFVALIMGIFFKERINYITGTAIILALAGVCILSMKGKSLDINYVGLGIVLLSALFYALYIVLVNKSKVKDMSGSKLTVYTMFFCAMFFMFKSLVQGESLSLPTLSSAGWIAFFALITTVISCISLVYAVHYIGSTPTAILGALEPVAAVGISVAVFSEPFTVNLFSGILLIIFAVTLNILSDKLLKKKRLI